MPARRDLRRPLNKLMTVSDCGYSDKGRPLTVTEPVGELFTLPISARTGCHMTDTGAKNAILLAQ